MQLLHQEVLQTGPLIHKGSHLHLFRPETEQVFDMNRSLTSVLMHRNLENKIPITNYFHPIPLL